MTSLCQTTPITEIMASPATTVLATYELLENILLNLPIKDLFIIQRVDSTWRDLIQRSDPLQHKMFLRPAGDVLHPDAKRLKYEAETIHINPGLVNRCFFCDGPNKPAKFPPGRFSCALFDKGDGNMVMHPSFSNAPVTGYRPSWHDMYLTQPPISLILRYATPDSPELTFRKPEGFTFGDLRDIEAYLRAEAGGKSDGGNFFFKLARTWRVYAPRRGERVKCQYCAFMDAIKAE